MYIKDGYVIDDLGISDSDLAELNNLYNAYCSLGNTIVDVDDMKTFIKFACPWSSVTVYKVNDEDMTLYKNDIVFEYNNLIYNFKK